MDRAPVGQRHDLRQLALRRKVSGDVFVVGSKSAQFLAYHIMRIKYESKLTNFMPQKGKRCREVYITADKDIRICCIVVSISHHFRSEIYI